MTHLLRKKLIGLPILLVAGLALTGCNSLNGADIVTVGDEDPIDEVDNITQDPPASPELSCAYPTTGDFGVAVNQIVPVDRQWHGFAAETSTAWEINISDYYDCDGSRGIDAIIIDTSQYG